jgi:FkbM family methyltransferase
MNHFFDIGANAGQTFDNFLVKTEEYDGWTVWCFEPSPRHFTSLLETVRRYRTRYQIIICPFAVTEQSGFFTLYEKVDSQGDSLIEDFIVENATSGYTLSVLGASLSALLLHHIADSDKVVLKLDCEGAEYGILENLLAYPEVLPKISRLLVEWHAKAGEHAEEITSLCSRFRDAGKPLERWMF